MPQTVKTNEHAQAGLAFLPHPKMERQPRPNPMEVLCLGLSRTGTMSTYAALNMLGLNSYHMVECGLDRANGSIPKWKSAVDAKYFNGKGKKLITADDFDELLWRYTAVTDMPCNLFPDELIAAYPDAKVILTTRDPDSWMRSMENSFYRILDSTVWRTLPWIDAAFSWDYVLLLNAPLKIWTGGHRNDRQKLREGFLKHNQHIRDVVPKDRLLEFHPKDGWEPLCKFLGKPIPDRPFPKINQGDSTFELLGTLASMRLQEVFANVVKAAVPVAVLGLAYWAYRRSL